MSVPQISDINVGTPKHSPPYREQSLSTMCAAKLLSATRNIITACWQNGTSMTVILLQWFVDTLKLGLYFRLEVRYVFMTFNTHHICRLSVAHASQYVSEILISSTDILCILTEHCCKQTNSLCISVMFALSLHRSNTMSSIVSTSETNCSS
jgi:hypothetical protein